MAPTVRGSTSVMVTTENRCQLVYAAAGKFLPLTDRNVSDAGSNYVAEPCSRFGLRTRTACTPKRRHAEAGLKTRILIGLFHYQIVK